MKIYVFHIGIPSGDRYIFTPSSLDDFMVGGQSVQVLLSLFGYICERYEYIDMLATSCSIVPECTVRGRHLYVGDRVALVSPLDIISVHCNVVIPYKRYVVYSITLGCTGGKDLEAWLLCTRSGLKVSGATFHEFGSCGFNENELATIILEIGLSCDKEHKV